MDCVRLDENNVVVEIFDGKSKNDLVFHPDLMARIVEVESNSVALGDRFDGARFLRPAAAVPAEIPGDAFLARLTDSEYRAILNAAQARLAAGDALLMRWLDGMRMRGAIDPASSIAVEVKGALVALDVLTAERADAVFARAA